MSEPQYRLVDHRQLSQGYLEQSHGIIYHRDYHVIRSNHNGTFVVREPQVSECLQSECLNVKDPALNARERTPISDSLGLDL